MVFGKIFEDCLSPQAEFCRKFYQIPSNFLCKGYFYFAFWEY